jgi:hypothetical protein
VSTVSTECTTGTTASSRTTSTTHPIVDKVGTKPSAATTGTAFVHILLDQSLQPGNLRPFFVGASLQLLQFLVSSAHLTLHLTIQLRQFRRVLFLHRGQLLPRVLLAVPQLRYRNVACLTQLAQSGSHLELGFAQGEAVLLLLISNPGAVCGDSLTVYANFLCYLSSTQRRGQSEESDLPRNNTE